MKKGTLLLLTGLISAAVSQAALFSPASVGITGDVDLGMSTSFTVDGITMTMTGTTNLWTEDANNGFFGINDGQTIDGAGNALKQRRINSQETLTISFDQDVTLKAIAFGNLITQNEDWDWTDPATTSHERALITSDGSAFDGLTGYDSGFSVANPQGGMSGNGVWGYSDTTDSFGLQISGGNEPDPVYFGTGGASTITITAGEKITFNVDGEFLAAGGYGIGLIEVIPEPATIGLITAMGVAILFVRRRLLI